MGIVFHLFKTNRGYALVTNFLDMGPELPHVSSFRTAPPQYELGSRCYTADFGVVHIMELRSGCMYLCLDHGTMGVLFEDGLSCW